MIKSIRDGIAKLGIENDQKIENTVDLISQFCEIEQNPREIALCPQQRLIAIKKEFLELVESKLVPILEDMKKNSVSMRVLAEQVESKVFRRLISPIMVSRKDIEDLRIPLEDALGSLIYELRFVLLNQAVNHPSCSCHDPQRAYVILYPDVEEDIRDTGMLYNILNQFYQNLSNFLTFESLPESFIPKSLKFSPNMMKKNWTIWEYIREIFQSGKLIKPKTWNAIGNELQALIQSGEEAINSWGNMMRLSDRVDFEERVQQFHQFSYSLAHCHVQCLNHFKHQNFDLITPADLREMVELTLQLDKTVSELQNFLRNWMRHLEARTCLHYTVVLQSIEQENQS